MTGYADFPQGIYTAASLMNMNLGPDEYYLEPYIPTEGIVLLHGKTGTYKTPITMNMAKAISAGTDLWGLKVTQASPILYVQMDMPRKAFTRRLKKLVVSDQNIHVACYQPGPDVLNPDSTDWSKLVWGNLVHWHEEMKFKVIFFDCLRKLHKGTDKDSEIPTLVYDALNGAFINAAIVLVHHDRKSRFDDTESMADESASGSQAWVNHAAVGIHTKAAGKKDSGLVSLTHHKSQVGELINPLILKAEEGVHISLSTEASRVDVMRALELLEKLEPGLSTTMKDKRVAVELGISVRTVQRRRGEAKEVLATDSEAQAQVTH